MNLSTQARKIHTQVSGGDTKLSDLRKIAKEIKKDHDLAMELWSTGDLHSRLLAILIMDKKQLTPEVIDQLDEDLCDHQPDERNQIADWLMANQLTKDKKIISLIETWEESPSAIKRRIFWYYQARLRWTGQTPPNNTDDLLALIEEKVVDEEPEVQWAMNFTAGWIGVYDEVYRSRCVKIGEKTGLYKDEVVPRGCTPSYLPEFIAIEVNKRKK